MHHGHATTRLVPEIHVHRNVLLLVFIPTLEMRLAKSNPNPSGACRDCNTLATHHGILKTALAHVVELVALL